MLISGPRAVLLATTAVVLTVVAVVAGLVLRAPSRTPDPGPRASAAERPVVGSLAVLRDWDRARARAWADGDLAGLRALYVRGSPAGSRDVAMLRAWLRRGLRVEDMAMQVLGIELRRRTDRRIVLVVTDRLTGAVGVRSGTGERLVLPRDGPSTRRLVFVRPGDSWLLASAQDAAPRSPVASTDPTSGSAKS
ncbi:hypothetical protein [Nocardioides nitrophenolicus]|uniref:hypothetical protein n=1 Tax=Nocardioides nitrophenolicus TaxID=60489 RepID=UPI001957EA99|nr:hypothetical protein [Nocardioides nitrophenolicus]MBM7520071.1 hypothetical protein [Nocardioides nitrophenolicus]